MSVRIYTYILYNTLILTEGKSSNIIGIFDFREKKCLMASGIFLVIWIEKQRQIQTFKRHKTEFWKNFRRSQSQVYICLLLPSNLQFITNFSRNVALWARLFLNFLHHTQSKIETLHTFPEKSHSNYSGKFADVSPMVTAAPP